MSDMNSNFVLTCAFSFILDYEFQVCISECLFRIIPKKVRDQTISTVFKNQARRKDFLAIRDNEFETVSSDTFCVTNF